MQTTQGVDSAACEIDDEISCVGMTRSLCQCTQNDT